MGAPPQSIRDLARRLIALDTAHEVAAAAGQIKEETRVLEQLQIAVTRFAGLHGFLSLLSRALVLARVDVPSLRAVTLQPDGTLEGMVALAVDGPHGRSEAAVAITAQLLWLLVTFIGESLTLRLVRDAWPDRSFEELH